MNPKDIGKAGFGTAVHSRLNYKMLSSTTDTATEKSPKTISCILQGKDINRVRDQHNTRKPFPQRLVQDGGRR